MSKKDLMRSASTQNPEPAMQIGEKTFPLVKSFNEHLRTPKRLYYKLIDKETAKKLEMAEQEFVALKRRYTETLMAEFGINAIYTDHEQDITAYGLNHDLVKNKDLWRYLPATNGGPYKHKGATLYAPYLKDPEGKKLSDDIFAAELKMMEEAKEIFVLNDTLSDNQKYWHEDAQNPVIDYIQVAVHRGNKGWYAAINNPDFVAYTKQVGVDDIEIKTDDVVFNYNAYRNARAEFNAYWQKFGSLYGVADFTQALTDVNNYKASKIAKANYEEADIVSRHNVTLNFNA